MKKQLLAASLVLTSTLTLSAQTPGIEWAHGFGGGGTSADNATATAMDAQGNIYTSGMFAGTADLDPTSGEFLLTSTGERDMYIQKLDANGNFVWAKGFQSTQSKYASALAVDHNGNVIMVGRFRGTLDFNPGSGTANLTASGLGGIPGTNDDAFVVKLDTDGNYMWAANMGQFNGDVAQYVNTDAAGNIYTTGYYNNNVDFNPDPGPVNSGDVLATTGGEDIFIQKLDANGSFIWAKGFGGTGNDRGKAVVVDDNQNVYLAVDIASSNTDFDSSDPTNAPIGTAGSWDIVVLKLNQAGNYEWAKRVGSSAEDNAWSIDLDNNGNPVVTGTFKGTVDFDPSSGSANLTSAGGADICTFKLDSDGNYEWATKVGGSSDDLGRWVTTDPAGNVYTTGFFRGTADFDPGSGVDNRTSAGDRDVYVQKLYANGNYVWAKTNGNSGDDYGIGIDHSASGELVIAGFFSGTVDFEDGSGVTELTSNGSRDSYVVKYFECAAPSNTASWSNAINGLDVAFTDLSSETPTSWSWDFGDGSTSNAQNPNHQYAAVGTYIVCLTTTNTCGTDQYCDTISICLEDAPTITGFSNVSHHGMTIHWSSNQLALGSKFVVRYHIFGDSPNFGYKVVPNTSANSAYVNGLDPNTRYVFRVGARCITQNQASFSDTASTWTRNFCTQPTGMAHSASLNTATLSWDDVSADQYKVKYREIGGNWTWINSNSNSVNISNLTPGTDYEWKVRAICNDGGNRPYVDMQQFSTASARLSGPSTEEFDLNVYPNPSNGQVVMQLHSEETPATITLTDMFGKKVFDERIILGPNFKRTLDFDVAAGTYIFQLISADAVRTIKLEIR